MTAEVLQEPDENGWVQLPVQKCEILTELSIKKLSPISPGRETIMRGKPIRLLWSDEAARALLASKFFRQPAVAI